MYEWKTGKRYRFRVYPANIMTAEYQDARLTGIVEHELANTMIDIYSSHARVYPSLPPSTPDNPTMYTYGVFLTEAGVRTVLGLAWVDESTIEVVSAQTLTASIENCTASDIEIVRQALHGIGKDQFTLKLSA